ncbi:MAG: hypothetical protein AAGA03_13825, partial [Planctomycetota bacterium]
MSDGSSSGKRASWRKSSARPQSGPASKSYQVGQSNAERRRLLFRVSLLGTLAIGLGVILYLVLRPNDPQVPLISVAVTQYTPAADGRLAAPPNPFAQEDLQRLEQLFGSQTDRITRNIRFTRTAEANGRAHQANEFLQAIELQLADSSVAPGGPNQDVIMLFLAAHGHVNSDGQACLLMSNSVVDDESSWLPMQRVLTHIVSVAQQHQRECRLVVFLDAARSGPVWQWGKLRDDFAVACRDDVTRLGKQNLAVVLSADQGQRSWSDLARGESLFVRGLTEALSGESSGEGSRFLTLGRVVTDLKQRVAATAESIWDAGQVPVLLASDDQASDWVLMGRPDSSEMPAPPRRDLAALSSDAEEARDLWRRHELLRQQTQPPLLTDPIAWAMLEAKLSRMDHLLLAGDAGKQRYQKLKSEAEATLSKLESSNRVAPTKLPERTFREHFAAADPSPDLVALRAQWAEKPDPKAWETPLTEEGALSVVWPWLTGQQFRPASLAAASKMMEQAGAIDSDSIRLLESALVRLLSSPDLSQINERSASAIMRAHLASRQALLCDDARAAHWVAGSLEELDHERRLATDRVLATPADAVANARLESLASEDYPRVAETASRISWAYRLRDRMLHEIPRDAESLLTDAEAFASEESASPSIDLVQRAMLDAQRLIKQLEVPTGLIDSA